MRKYLIPCVGLALALATVWSYNVPDVPMFAEPSLARIIFFHLSCTFAGLITYVWGVVSSFRFLAKRSMAIDVRSEAVNEMTAILFTMTMATGIVFSKVQWGAWWQGDPRQVSFLLVLLLQLAYLLLRAALVDEQKRAAASAVYNVATFLPVVFLTAVFPRLPQVVSLSSHPTQTIQKGLRNGEYAYVFLAVWILLSIFVVMLIQQRVSVESMRLAKEEKDGELDGSGDSAGYGVVRPISVLNEHGTQD